LPILISLSVEYQLPMPRCPISRLPTAFTSSMLPFLTPGIVPSLCGAGGAVPGGAAGVTVGGGNGPVAVGIGASLSIDLLSVDAGAELPGAVLGVVDGVVCAGALALGGDWLGGAEDEVEGGCVEAPLACAQPATGAKTRLAASASFTTRHSIIED